MNSIPINIPVSETQIVPLFFIMKSNTSYHGFISSFPILFFLLEHHVHLTSDYLYLLTLLFEETSQDNVPANPPDIHFGTNIPFMVCICIKSSIFPHLEMNIFLSLMISVSLPPFFIRLTLSKLNAAIGYGEILMNRVVMQKMNILFIQVRNRKEQRYNATNTTDHQ